MPIATIIPGTISGERINALTSLLPPNRPRTSATAAGVPSVVASTITASPTQRLSQAEESQSARVKKLRYHRRLNPGGGKLKYVADENDSGATTRIGRIR